MINILFYSLSFIFLLKLAWNVFVVPLLAWRYHRRRAENEKPKSLYLAVMFETLLTVVLSILNLMGGGDKEWFPNPLWVIFYCLILTILSYCILALASKLMQKLASKK
jgi:protein-S-isoprenylcysteine O-methyltransferase Ste14